MFNLEEDIDIEFIKDGNQNEAMDAGRRICEYEFPLSDKLIYELTEIARNKESRHWARIASVMTLGQRDRHGRSGDVMYRISKDDREDGWLREYANTALLRFMRHQDEYQPCSE